MTPMMRNHILALLSLLATATSLPTAAQTSTPDASRVFPMEAALLGGTPGRVVYLPIPTEVLAQTAPDLADLRVHSATGQELPYVVDSASRARSTAQIESEYARVLRTDRRIEDGDSLAPTYVERFEIAVPDIAGTLDDGAWSSRRLHLNFEIHREAYVAQVKVIWVAMERQMVLNEGSVYRFSAPQRQDDELDLGFAPDPPEEGTKLVVELRGEAGYLEPTMRFTARADRIEPRILDVPLELLSSGSADGVTTVRLARPAGVMPDRLRLHTTTPNFHRQVEVSDDAQGQPTRQVGRGLVYRLAEVNGAEVSSVDVARTAGQALIVRIVNEDSPPLAELSFSAEVTQPMLAFTAEPGAILRFGGGRVRAPTYDLMRVRSGLLGDGAFSDPALMVHLGPITANPNFDAGPALGFAFAPGRAVPISEFTTRATVHVEGASEGLSRLELSPALLAKAQESLGDLRVLDTAGRQHPYLLGAEEVRQLDLPVPSAEVHGGDSTYELTLPAAPLRVSALRLDTDAEYLARNLSVFATLASGRETKLATLFLGREPGTHDSLVIEFQTTRVQGLRLEVEDGGDAPLEFTQVALDAPASPLFLVAPDGDYTLYFGDAELEAPVYELSRARALVLSLPAAEALVGQPAANPAHVPPAWYAGDSGQTWLVWAALLVALLVLVSLTLRVVRAAPMPEQNEAPSDSPADEAPSAEATKVDGSSDSEASPPESDRKDGQEDPVE